MTPNTTEEKFQQLRQSLTPAQFNDTVFLTAKAEQIEEQDKALSQRILVRVNNLKKNSKNGQLNSKPAGQSGNQSDGNLSRAAAAKAKIKRIVRHSPFALFVVLPCIMFALYQSVIATERYESQAQVIVKQPDGAATMDASMAMLSGLGLPSSSGSDTELVKAYIYSNDMLQYLQTNLDLRSHFSAPDIDWFSRLANDATREELFEYYHDHVAVEINDISGVVSIYTQGFAPEFATQLANVIVTRAEWYINSIGHQLAKAQLKFVSGEHLLVETKLQKAQSELLKFQQQHNLLDPTAEGVAVQQIAYQLEGQITAKEAELKNLRTIMSDQAPKVIAMNSQLTALKAQLVTERNKLSHHSEEQSSVGEILAQYSDLKVKADLALQAYTASQISLEKSRIEAYRQLKYLITVESATLSQESKYPDVFYNVSLFALVLSMAFVICRIIISTVRELK
ncbi:lipopolysaccharide biosynthesis protein [Vibrio sp. B1FLJ16]|uniref:lipopolysaccharide biosynthesis protein n=1 Tax=Vibrio sp. B1FLJ16 TaxID=2751178 RepID=UPI0015F43960|nr:lipopolysaccharide biosynthesis protein [Vibrio sp. B1FLJ16]